MQLPRSIAFKRNDHDKNGYRTEPKTAVLNDLRARMKQEFEMLTQEMMDRTIFGSYERHLQRYTNVHLIKNSLTAVLGVNKKRLPVGLAHLNCIKR